MKRHLNNKTYNYYAIIIVALITTTIALNLDYSNAGMAAIVVVWLPLVFSVITGLVYYLSHYILKECHWLVTLIGSLFVIYLTVGIALTDFTT